MLFLVVFGLFLTLDVAALIWGVDSRDQGDWRSRRN
jgi:hypothetical protein